MLGREVQVDPIRPTLKAPGTKRLEFEYDELLSSFAFNRPISVYHFPRRALTLCPQLCMGISPRRYTEIGLLQLVPLRHGGRARRGEAAHVDPITPKLKPPGTKHLKLKL